ncbi:MAG: flagellar biosynthesis protein FlhB [Gammaproteobacteria bacterium]|nr:MAG: flagellar biosynthesis protein FlhB [Gammaproteobacteria bacterium]
MDENEAAGEKTEQPTPKRLQDAREQGQLPRSRELTTAVVACGALLAFTMLGERTVNALGGLSASVWSSPRAVLLDPAAPPRLLIGAIEGALRAVAPWALVVLAVGAAAPALLGGWVFTGKALTPDWKRLDPVRGLKRVFGLQGWVELGKSLLKFALLSAAAAAALWWLGPRLVTLGEGGAARALRDSMAALLAPALALCAALLVIAAVDAPFQLWNHRRRLRMTRQELRDELRQSEGDPELRAKVRAVQQKLASQRMMQQVPKADVVVSNPTHFAVALRYRREQDSAPVVLAKGQDQTALHILRIARGAGVPVFEAPPLARALYYTTEVGRRIPRALYVAVAQVLAYVYEVANARRQGRRPPAPPARLEVPEELTRPRRGRRV